MLIADIYIKIPLSILLPQEFYWGWNSDHTNKVKRYFLLFFLRENLPCSTFSINVMKRSDRFHRLWFCYHAATPDWNKWPWGDSEGMGITHLRNSLLTSDMLFHTLFTSRLDCIKYQSLHLQLMGWELSAPQRFTHLSCGQHSRTAAPPETCWVPWGAAQLHLGSLKNIHQGNNRKTTSQHRSLTAFRHRENQQKKP